MRKLYMHDINGMKKQMLDTQRLLFRGRRSEFYYLGVF